MQGDSAILDHVVINVQTRLDAGAAAYGNLGFSLTERGHHTLGTSNHLALFQQDYLELLGVEAGRPNPGWDIVANAVGIQGLAFKTGDADALYWRLTEDRLPALPPEEFSRPVTLREGTFDARFKVVGVNPSPLQGVRFFFCQHLTPHLVWRREWQSHANGALGIAHLLVAVSDPVRAGEAFARLLGIAARRPIAGGLEIEAGGVACGFWRTRQCAGLWRRRHWPNRRSASSAWACGPGRSRPRPTRWRVAAYGRLSRALIVSPWPLPTRWASCSTSCPDCSCVAPQNFFEMPAK
jgi:hypothetical protein